MARKCTMVIPEHQGLKPLNMFTVYVVYQAHTCIVTARRQMCICIFWLQYILCVWINVCVCGYINMLVYMFDLLYCSKLNILLLVTPISCWAVWPKTLPNPKNGALSVIWKKNLLPCASHTCYIYMYILKVCAWVMPKQTNKQIKRPLILLIPIYKSLNWIPPRTLPRCCQMMYTTDEGLFCTVVPLPSSCSSTPPQV